MRHDKPVVATGARTVRRNRSSDSESLAYSGFIGARGTEPFPDRVGIEVGRPPQGDPESEYAIGIIFEYDDPPRNVRFPIGLDAAEHLAVKITDALARIRDGELKRATQRASGGRESADEG
jgi:hypothetical protein